MKDDKLFHEEWGFDKYTETSSLKKGIEDLIGRLDPTGERVSFQTEIQKAWEKVAGASTLLHTEAIFMKDETVFIWMDSSIWASEINLIKDEYLAKINEKLNSFKVSQIRVSANKFKKSLKSF